MFKVKSTIFSGIGPRKQMQDAGLFRNLPHKKQSWCIVCDGIGGTKGGAEAANTCVKEYDNFLLNSKSNKLVNNTVDYLKLLLSEII